MRFHLKREMVLDLVIYLLFWVLNETISHIKIADNEKLKINRRRVYPNQYM